MNMHIRTRTSAFLVVTLLLNTISFSQAATLKPLEGYASSPTGGSFNELFSKKILNDKLFEKAAGGEYFDTTYDASQITTAKGKLNLGSSLISGIVHGSEVTSKKLYDFGSVTWKAMANPAPGMVSTVYLANESEDGSTREEIDMELSSDNPKKISISDYHGDAGDSTDPKTDTHQTEIIDVSAVSGLSSFKSTKFNTYKIEWIPGRIRWYVNNKQIAEHIDSIPTTPMKLHLTTYHVNDWSEFSQSSVQGDGTFVIDQLKYAADEKLRPVALTTKKMQIKGDQECKNNVNAALEQLKGEPWYYNFVVTYVDLVECVEKGSVMYVSEMPRRHTAGRPGRDDAVQFADDLTHEACHSWEYTTYLEQHPGVYDVPEDVYGNHDGEEKCLNIQVEYLRRIGEKERAEGYKDAMASEWWKVPLEDMQY